MSKELPFFKFSPSEWLIGKISFQSLELQGAFIQFISVCWKNNGSITSDDIDFRITKDNLNKLIDLGFVINVEGNLSVKFLSEQITDFKEVIEKRTIAGAKGGQAKAKQVLAIAKQNVADKDKDKDKEEDIRLKREVDKEEKTVAPALSDVISYFNEKGYRSEIAERAFNMYDVNNWFDTKGNKVRNWKMKMQSVWFKEENKIKPEFLPTGLNRSFVP